MHAARSKKPDKNAENDSYAALYHKDLTQQAPSAWSIPYSQGPTV